MELKKLLLISIVSLIVSCGNFNSGHTSEKCENDDKNVELAILKHYSDDLTQYYINNADGYTYITNGCYLHQLYESSINPQKGDYSDVVQFITSEGVEMPMTDPRTDFCFYDERFVIETGILKYCEKYGVSSLLKKYCKHENGFLRFKNLSNNAKKTIAYCASKEGYYYAYGGYSGDEYLYRKNKESKGR